MCRNLHTIYKLTVIHSILFLLPAMILTFFNNLISCFITKTHITILCSSYKKPVNIEESLTDKQAKREWKLRLVRWSETRLRMKASVANVQKWQLLRWCNTYNWQLTKLLSQLLASTFLNATRFPFKLYFHQEVKLLRYSDSVLGQEGQHKSIILFWMVQENGAC